jgi:hypothetical protein
VKSFIDPEASGTGNQQLMTNDLHPPIVVVSKIGRRCTSAPSIIPLPAEQHIARSL